MKFKYLYTGFVFFLTALAACVSEYEFETQEQTFTVISGVITNSLGERTINVKQITGLNIEGEPLEASGAIFKNGELEVELVPLSPGELVVPLAFSIEEGATYYTEIYANEKVYQTTPVQIPEKLKTDSLSFKLEERLEGFTNLGAPLYQWYVDVFAHVSILGNEAEHKFFKWQVDESWAVISNAGVCYINEPVTENESTIASSKELVSGSVAIRINSVPLDETFIDKHYMNAYLHSLDRKTYENYEKAQRLMEGTGTFFDEVPAPFSGNVYVADGEQETVLGIVEYSLVDTLRLPIARSDIEIRVFNPCSSLVPCPGNGPCVCEDCTAVYGPLSINKPFYWE